MRIVFFDVDGVLVHGYHAKPERRICWDDHLERDLGINREHFKENFIFGPFVNEVIIGKRDVDEALNSYFQSINQTIDVERFITYWLTNDSNVNKDLFKKIEILKNSEMVRLAIATNQEHKRANHLMNNLGFRDFFDDIFHSARMGFRKPDQKYFEEIMRHIGGQEEPPIFFDDTQSVVDAANDFGWEAYQFDDVSDLNKSNFIKDLLS